MKGIRELAFEAYLREGDDVSQRIDWALIFHGILLEAFFAGTTSKVQHLALGALGATTAYLWLLIGTRQVWHMRHLIQAVIGEPEPEDVLRLFHSRLTAFRKRKEPWILRRVRAAPIFAIIVPCATWITWVTVTVTTVCPWHEAALTIFATMALATLASFGLADKPVYSKDDVKALYSDTQ